MKIVMAVVALALVFCAGSVTSATVLARPHWVRPARSPARMDGSFRSAPDGVDGRARSAPVGETILIQPTLIQRPASAAPQPETEAAGSGASQEQKVPRDPFKDYKGVVIFIRPTFIQL